MEHAAGNFNYYKAHNTALDVYSGELGYSLLYDNIHPDKVSEALATVGLDSLPNRFFLIQVDDYANQTRKMQITQESHQKVALVNLLRSRVKELDLKGFGLNLIGYEQMMFFLCCDEQEGKCINDFLVSVARKLQAEIRAKSQYTISVCISKHCQKIIDYSQFFPKMSYLLAESYFAGRESILLSENTAKRTKKISETADLYSFYPEILAAISQDKPEMLSNVLQRIGEVLLKSHIHPQRARLMFIRLMQRVETYCIHSEVPENVMLDYYEETIEKIFASHYISDTCSYFREYCENAAKALKTYVDDSNERAFTTPVEEYIKEHYHEDIRLKDAADVMGFSEGHFARMFRRNFETSFVDYLNTYRIEEGRLFLQQLQIPLEQIAYKVGFNNYSYFCTCFKKKYGLSPRAYRDEKSSADDHEKIQEN